MRALQRHGFSLTELLVVLAIMGILFGLAVFGFIGLSRSLRLSSSAEALNQAFVNSRQQAITSRSARRVGIHMLEGSFWTDRENVRAGRTSSNRWELASDIQYLPKLVVIGDINGFTASQIPGNEKIWYIEFDARGSASAYAVGQPPERTNVGIHLIMENARIPLSETDKVQYNLADSQLLNFIGSIGGYDLDGDGQDDESGVDVKIAAEARKQVNTVFVLALTGRSQVFEYGYEYPWSDVDVVEP